MIQTLQNWASYLVPPTITNPVFTRGPGFWTNPEQENLTGFFEQLIGIDSQHENWYQVTPYIAEFWCTVSNVAILYAGVANSSPELVFAGMASMASHAIPRQWLLHVDKAGVILIVMRVLSEYQFLMKKPKLLVPLAGALSLLLADMHLSRRCSATWSHIVWHCVSPNIVGHFLQLAKQDRLQPINQLA